MREIELNPDGTFPHKYPKPEETHATFTVATTLPEDFIANKPKKGDWKKDVTEMVIFIFIWWCFVNGVVMIFELFYDLTQLLTKPL